MAVIFGTSGSNARTGTAADDTIYGGPTTVIGADLLSNDTLDGGGGGDLSAAPATTGSASPARSNGATPLPTSNPAGDPIEVSRAGFSTSLVVGGAVPLVFNVAAMGAGPHVRYYTGSGNPSFDPDGSGAASSALFATLTNLPVGFSAADIAVIA